MSAIRCSPIPSLAGTSPKELLYRLAGFLGFRFGHFGIIVGVIEQGDDKVVSIFIAVAFIFSPFVYIEKHRAKIFSELGANSF